jgi:hypothetical protein
MVTYRRHPRRAFCQHFMEAKLGAALRGFESRGSSETQLILHRAVICASSARTNPRSECKPLDFAVIPNHGSGATAGVG